MLILFAYFGDHFTVVQIKLEYNGYKVYWNDGGQIVPPHDGAIIAEVNALSFDAIKFDANASNRKIIRPLYSL